MTMPQAHDTPESPGGHISAPSASRGDGRCSRLLRRFRADTNGLAAVEFAYLVPLILLMFVGTVELSRAVSIHRRFDLVTSMISDLVSREKSMTAADVTAVYKTITQVMSPFDSSTLKVSVIPVKASPSDASDTRVYAATTNRPSHNGGTQPAKCSSYALSAGLVPKGASVIVVESTFSYTPLVAGYVVGPLTWTSKSFSSPRNSCVDFDSDNCVSTCF